MILKILLVGLLCFMIFNLFKAMRIMLKTGETDENMSKFIGRRVITSVIIFALIILAVATGLIEPNPRPY
jgi:hypothetical protein